MESNPHVWIDALRRSHDRLAGLVQSLTPDQLRDQSYCSEWSVAQVLSHLGSGAEIALLGMPGALGEAEPVGRDEFGPVWEKWNAKSPQEQASDAVAMDERYVGTLERLTDDQLGRMTVSFLGMQFDCVGIIRLRLGEHTMHTWDVAVYRDPDAVLSAVAVTLLIDNVAQSLAPRLGKPLGEPFAVRITTSDPDRDYLLAADEPVSMTDWPGEDAAPEVPHLQMPAEALLRLAYGRLDAAHTPATVSGDRAALDKLRAIFPGF